MPVKQLAFLYIRGALFNGVYNERVKKAFLETYKELLNRKNKKSYSNNMIDFMLAMMDNAKEELDKGNLLLAGYDIDLLHNLPETIHNNWNEEYFYKGELVGYLDHMIEADRIDKIKKVIFLVGKYLVERDGLIMTYGRN